MNKDQEDYIIFATQRLFAALSRNILCLMEDNKKTHDINFEKLYQKLPEFQDVVDMANYLDEEHYNHNRKRILDIVNSAKRDLETTLQYR